MTEKEKIKDYLFTFTQGYRLSLIEMIKRLEQIEDFVEEKFGDVKKKVDTRNKRVG